MTVMYKFTCMYLLCKLCVTFVSVNIFLKTFVALLFKNVIYFCYWRTLPMNTGEKIKYFRLARNMTQEQLAQEADISFSTLRKYEANERNPKYEQLSKIAAALEISVNIFMDFDIESVSDLLSILFKMESQADLEITTTKESAPSLSDDTLFLHFKNEYINSILRMYHLSVEDIKDMDIQQQEKALAEIQNRLLDNNSSIHSDNPISTDSKKSVLPLSSADQMWLELSSDCSEEEKEKMLKAATFTKNCLRHSDK